MEMMGSKIYFILVLVGILYACCEASKPENAKTKEDWTAGFWQKKTLWKPRWVKTWQEKKYYLTTWKKVWGPVEVNEWVPLPKPPAGWTHHNL